MPIVNGFIVNYDAKNDNKFVQLWNMMTMGICNKLFYPLFDNIISEMKTQLNSILWTARAIVIVVLIVAVIDVIVIFYEMISSETKMHFDLYLLTFCPSKVVLQT